MILDPEKVEELFITKAHQAEVMVGLYRMVFPDYDKIAAFEGWPTVSKETAKLLCGKFIKFDQKHHPDVVAGGLWINNGFSTLEETPLKLWEVDPSTCPVRYEDAAGA